MGFFRHTPKPSVSSIESFHGDLTMLDPPSLPSHVPIMDDASSVRHSERSFQLLSQQNARAFTTKAQTIVSPTDSQFSSKSAQYVATSAGLQGEMERNLILEQQVRLLSQQAALALDRLSDVSKDNERLKSENEDLKARQSKKQRFSFSRRQSSISSIASSTTNRSIFTNNVANAGTLSPGTSMSSINTYLEQSRPTMKVKDTSQIINELQQSHSKEISLLKVEYEEEIKSLKQECETYQAQLEENRLMIEHSLQQIEALKAQQIQDSNAKKSLLNKFDIFKKQQKIKDAYYQQQLQDALCLLDTRRAKDYELRQKLNEYGNIHLKTHLAGNPLMT